MTTINDADGWYATTFKRWLKAYGPKPTADQLAAIHDLGPRPGKQAMANAMALRDEGVTGSQIIGVCGAQQLNKMRELERQRYIQRVPTSKSADGLTVYKYVIAPKGQKRIDTVRARRAAAVADEAAVSEPRAVKGAVKAKKATKVAKKAKAAVQPALTVEAATDQLVAQPATADRLPVVSPLDYEPDAATARLLEQAANDTADYHPDEPNAPGVHD